MKQVIAITLGDISGIGPEVVLKALKNNSLIKRNNFLIIGSKVALPQDYQDCLFIQDQEDLDFKKYPINFLDLDNIKREDFKLGEINKNCGRVALEFIKKAVELTLSKKVVAIVTAPLNKEAVNLAGFNFSGQTGFLAALTETSSYTMMLVSKRLKVALVTIHSSLRKAIEDISIEKILVTIKLVNESLSRCFKIKRPRIAVASLNPHAGEGGFLGDEEKSFIIPAINKAWQEGIEVWGPFSPDTIFYKTTKGEFDVVVAMYHDQGLIPLKLLAFEEAVNVTVGLPIIRTSPDHGTAFDIVGKGIANHKSMIEAIKLASFMVNKI